MKSGIPLTFSFSFFFFIDTNFNTGYKNFVQQKLFPSDPVKVKEGKRLLSSVQKWSEFEIWNLNALFDK